MIYPDTRHIDFFTWSNQLIRDAQIDDLRPFLPWQQWAAKLVRKPYFAKIRIPSPFDYQAWDKWAIEVYKTCRSFIYE